MTYVCRTCGATVEPILVPVVHKYVRGTCPTCGPEWAKEEAERVARVEALEREKRLEKYKHAFPFASMGERLQAATLSTFLRRPGTESAFADAQRFATTLPDPDPRGLLIWGEPGNGKSHLAAGIAHEARDHGLTVAWIHAPTWLRQIGVMESDEREMVLAMAARAEVMVMDELGGGKQTASRLDWLLYVLDERYRHRRSMVLTSNLSPNQLAGALNIAPEDGGSPDLMDGRRLVDRLAGMCRIVQNKATSYRREAAR